MSSLRPQHIPLCGTRSMDYREPQHRIHKPQCDPGQHNVLPSHNVRVNTPLYRNRFRSSHRLGNHYYCGIALKEKIRENTNTIIFSSEYKL